MEDQDKIRNSGIFRDVYLIYRPFNHIRDFSISTELNDDFSHAEIRCSIDFIDSMLDVDHIFEDCSGREGLCSMMDITDDTFRESDRLSDYKNISQKVDAWKKIYENHIKKAGKSK